ncbi:MAG: hypothetical protein K2K06_07450 [Oscillospiraceae bacterium]|nr:hypothetical protein [Oscillospiraceae bacterium]
MVLDILKNSGIPFRKSRFLKPPTGTYAVYMDDIETMGGDDLVAIYHHQITIELYESGQDDIAEQALEQAISETGTQWQKQDKYWLQSVERYQVVYEFDYYEKRRF